MNNYGYYDYGYTDYSSLGGITSAFIILFSILMIISLAVSILRIIGTWKVLKKAGKGGWECLIPFYNDYVLVEIAGLNWWWYLISFSPLILGFIGLAWIAPFVSIFVLFNTCYNISKKFNKGTGFAICLTLFFPICICILGFSKNNVYNNVYVSNNGVFGPSGINSNNNVNNNAGYTNQNVNNIQQMNSNSVMSDQNMQNINNQSATNFQTQEISFCGNCGTKLDSSVRFCPNCGKEIV